MAESMSSDERYLEIVQIRKNRQRLRRKPRLNYTRTIVRLLASLAERRERQIEACSLRSQIAQEARSLHTSLGALPAFEHPSERDLDRLMAVLVALEAVKGAIAGDLDRLGDFLRRGGLERLGSPRRGGRP